ncbi:acyl-CoA N-acyltransferase [Xylariomycetidae sp. FL2044]|nr:acyl-CoA N-acyltransferase [Xylariomycetidae sp. FL2044]
MGIPTVKLFSPSEHSHLIPYIAAIHTACITHDQTIATFLPPLDTERLVAYWQEWADEVSQGKRFISILFNQAAPGSSEPAGPELVGVVALSMPTTETGPLRVPDSADSSVYRGTVEKLLVSPEYRRQGGARALMTHLESEALKRGRHLLDLGTEIGSPAELVYPRLGYVEIGKIPKYGISPVTRELKDHIFYYKQL